MRPPFPTELRRPASVALYTFREHLGDLPTLCARIAALGYRAVEPLCFGTMASEIATRLPPGFDVDAATLRRVLDDHGLVVTSAHAPLPEPSNAAAVLDEQETLGSSLLVITAMSIIPGAAGDELNRLDTIKQMADRFNVAAEL